MKYTTFDYLRDNHWYIDLSLMVLEKLRHLSKNLYEKLIQIEYDYYIFGIFENLPYAIIIVFLGFFAVTVLARYTEKESGLRISTITTPSMKPAINPGSLIVSLPKKEYKEGDIITYKEVNPKTNFETGRVLTHRIIDSTKNGNKTFYITKGDGNEQPDPQLVDKNVILGATVLIIPNIGYLDVLIRTVPGFLIFIFVPTLLLIKNEISYLKTQKYRSISLYKVHLARR